MFFMRRKRLTKRLRTTIVSDGRAAIAKGPEAPTRTIVSSVKTGHIERVRVDRDSCNRRVEKVEEQLEKDSEEDRRVELRKQSNEESRNERECVGEYGEREDDNTSRLHSKHVNNQ